MQAYNSSERGEKFTFNGADTSLNRKNYTISQPGYVEKLKRVAEDHVSKSDFVAQQARGAYIAAVGRPDPTFDFA